MAGNENKLDVDKKIKDAINSIGNVLKIDKAILFGSYATGNPQGNIEKIFPHYFDALVSGDMQSNKERLLYFLSDLRVYLERGGDMKSHNISDLQPERMGLLKQGLEGLYKMGYCDKCIPKLIYFAFDEAEYKEAFAALKKS